VDGDGALVHDVVLVGFHAYPAMSSGSIGIQRLWSNLWQNREFPSTSAFHPDGAFFHTPLCQTNIFFLRWHAGT
jgi:hypothetical protein